MLTVASCINDHGLIIVSRSPSALIKPYSIRRFIPFSYERAFSTAILQITNQLVLISADLDKYTTQPSLDNVHIYIIGKYVDLLTKLLS